MIQSGTSPLVAGKGGSQVIDINFRESNNVIVSVKTRFLGTIPRIGHAREGELRRTGRDVIEIRNQVDNTSNIEQIYVLFGAYSEMTDCGKRDIIKNISKFGMKHSLKNSYEMFIWKKFEYLMALCLKQRLALLNEQLENLDKPRVLFEMSQELEF